MPRRNSAQGTADITNSEFQRFEARQHRRRTISDDVKTHVGVVKHEANDSAHCRFTFADRIEIPRMQVLPIDDATFRHEALREARKGLHRMPTFSECGQPETAAF